MKRKFEEIQIGTGTANTANVNALSRFLFTAGHATAPLLSYELIVPLCLIGKSVHLVVLGAIIKTKGGA